MNICLSKKGELNLFKHSNALLLIFQHIQKHFIDFYQLNLQRLNLQKRKKKICFTTCSNTIISQFIMSYIIKPWRVRPNIPLPYHHLHLFTYIFLSVCRAIWLQKHDSVQLCLSAHNPARMPVTQSLKQPQAQPRELLWLPHRFSCLQITSAARQPLHQWSHIGFFKSLS